LTSLASRERFPDLTLRGAIMPRGVLDPMWQAEISVPLPLWGPQRALLREARLRRQAAKENEEEVRHEMRQRIEERRAMLTALLETNRLYRTGVLVQSEAAVSSALSQYKVGRVPFASVLEALSGYLSDLAGYYESLAATQRVDIAHRELSLGAVDESTLGGLGAASMPGASDVGSGGRARSASPGPQPAAGSSSGMPGM
jgi:hypothetical protein